MDSLSPRARATRTAILQAALDCFAAEGFRATTTRAIAARAGVTQPLIHHYFGSKEALFDAVLAHAAEDYEMALQPQLLREMDDLAFMTEGLVVLFRWLEQQEALLRLSMWARLEGRAAPGHRAVQLFGQIRIRLEHAREIGIFRPGVDIDAVMILIDAAFKGFWDRRAVVGAYPVDQADFDSRYLRQTVEILCLGLMTPEAAATVRTRITQLERGRSTRSLDGLADDEVVPEL